jgi:hypothetical protein
MHDASNSHEVVLLEFNNIGGVNVTSDVLQELVALINATVGTWLVPNNAHNTLPTIGDMVAHGQRILATFGIDDVAAGTTFLWPGSFILNSYANSDNLTTMMAFNDAEVKSFQSYTDPALYKVRWCRR